MSQRRIVAIDATRGAAMLFVFLSHFSISYMRLAGHLNLVVLLYRISMVASPTFMLISGIILGYLFETHKENFQPIRRTLVGRGIFLLTVGRVLILIAHIPFAGGFRQALTWGFITDSIGVSVICGTIVIGHLRSLHRLFLGIFLYVISWWMILVWFPEPTVLRAVKYVLFGPLSGYQNSIYADVFPLLPWFGIYLVGSSMGSRLGKLLVQNQTTEAATFVLFTALASLSVALVIHGLKLSLGAAVPSDKAVIWFHLFQTEKLPPTFTYFLFYGGIGLLILYSFLKFERLRFVGRAMELLQVLGQVSLVAFILQYYVYFSLFIILNLKYSVFWPLYFAVSVCLIYVPTRFAFRHGFNKYLSVPYSRMLDFVLPWRTARERVSVERGQ